jgi:hypothetical protein
VTAAALHVGLLSPDAKPTGRVLLSLPYFDTQKSRDHGILQYVGSDEEGNLVFSVGLETAAQQAVRALRNLLAITGAEAPPFVFVATMPAVNLWMKIGGVCSRVFGLKGIGRPLVIWGIRRAYPDLVRLVQEVKGREEGE